MASSSLYCSEGLDHEPIGSSDDGNDTARDYSDEENVESDWESTSGT